MGLIEQGHELFGKEPLELRRFGDPSLSCLSLEIVGDLRCGCDAHVRLHQGRLEVIPRVVVRRAAKGIGEAIGQKAPALAEPVAQARRDAWGRRSRLLNGRLLRGRRCGR